MLNMRPTVHDFQHSCGIMCIQYRCCCSLSGYEGMICVGYNEDVVCFTLEGSSSFVYFPIDKGTRLSSYGTYLLGHYQHVQTITQSIDGGVL
jgi:hypothetical protein